MFDGNGKYWALAAVAVVVVALVARARGASGGDVTVVPADPNVEATNQAQLAAKAGAFSSLADNLFGYRTAVVSGARDVNVAALDTYGGTVSDALAASAAATSDYYDALVASIQDAGATTRARVADAGETARAQIRGSVDLAVNAADNLTSRQRAQLEYDTAVAGFASADRQAADANAAGRYYADQETARTRDTNRTSLAITNAQVGAQRQRNTNSVINTAIGYGVALLGALI